MLRRRNPAPASARDWTDEAMLDVLHRLDHDGQSAREVARAYGVSRNAILGLRFRCLGPLAGRLVAEPGDGTMAPRWWVRA